MISRRALLPMLAPFLAGLSWFSVAADLQKFATSELTIISATGPHGFKVELAETPAQMTQGLMFRTSLAPPMPACCSTTRSRQRQRCG